MRHYKQPYWLKAKFTGKCRKCGKEVLKGDDILYFPSEKIVYCKSDDCGQQWERDNAAAAFDEAAYCGHW